MKLPNFEFKSESPEPLPNKEKVLQLRESFMRKVRAVSELRKDIEKPELASLTDDKFDDWIAQRKEKLGKEFPKAREALEKLEQKKEQDDVSKILKEKREAEASIDILENKAFEEYKKINPESVEEFEDELDFDSIMEFIDRIGKKEEYWRLQDVLKKLEERIYGLESKYEEALNTSENPFLYTLKKFLDGIAEKRKNVIHLRKSFEVGIQQFADKMPGDLRQYIESKKDNAVVEFTSYDVIVYISKADRAEFFNTSYSNNNGWHYSGTPISVVVKRKPEEELYTKTHEMGHNIMECAASAGVHNTRYAEISVRGIKERIKRLDHLRIMQTPYSLIESEEESVREIIRNQRFQLNGEISADAENIVGGRLSAFYFHFINTVNNLDGLTRQRSPTLSDKTSKMVREEMEILEKQTAAHLKEVLFFAYLARKYSKEDEFCSILVMNPDSPRLLRRFFSEELGSKFNFEVQMNKLLPETKLPDVLHKRIYDIHQQVGSISLIISPEKNQQLIRKLRPPKELIPENVSDRGNIYSSFEHEFSDLYTLTDFLSPRNLPKFLSVTENSQGINISGSESNEVNDRIKELLRDFYGNSLFFSLYDSNFYPGNASIEAWKNSIDSIRSYEAQLQKLCKYIGDMTLGNEISKQLYDTVVYKALKAAVVVDDPTPVRQVFEHWKMEVDKNDFLSPDGEFLPVYDFVEWFENESDVSRQYADSPEKTKLYQYFISLFH